MVTSQDNSKKDVKFLKAEPIQGRDEHSSSVSKPRRILLKGAAAVPVIMTLPSGAAAAMSSSEACTSKAQQLAESEQPNWLAESTDTWVRKEVMARQLQSNRFSEPFWVYQPHEDVDRWLDQHGRSYYTQIDAPMEGAGIGDPMEGTGIGNHEDERILWARRTREEAGIQVKGAGISDPIEGTGISAPMEGAGNGNCMEGTGIGNHEDERILWARRTREEAGIQMKGAGIGDPMEGTGIGNCMEGAGIGDPMEGTENGNYMKGPGNSNFLIVTGETTRYVIAQVDESGAIIGFGPSDQFNHITGSCWYSVNPTTI